MPVYLNREQGEYVKSTRRAHEMWKERTAGDLSLNPGAQRKHIKGTDEFNDALTRANKNGYPSQSYLSVDIEECQRIVERYAGKGEPVIIRGTWMQKEKCTTDDIIGKVVLEDGSEVATKHITIHYSKRGTHIVPREKKR